MKVIPESEENSGTLLSIDNITVYNTDIEYLLDELHRIDLVIRFYLNKYRANQQGFMDDLRGLYISEDEIDTILQTPLFEKRSGPYSDPELEHIETLTREINQKKKNSIERGKKLRHHMLSVLFYLTPFEIDILLICLAPELDQRYEKLYSYLQNDVTKKRPTVDLVMNILFSSVEERFTARETFLPTSPLIRNRLIYLYDGQDDQLPLLSKYIKIDERIINFLLGSDEIDSGIRDFSKKIEPNRSFRDLMLEADNKNNLIELIKWHSRKKIPLIFLFHGPYGTGKKLTAEAICKGLKMPLLIVDSKALAKDETFETLDLVVREAKLQNSLLYLEGFDTLLKDEASGINAMNLIQELDYFPNWVFLSSEIAWEPKAVLKKHGFIRHEVPLPSFALRQQMWKSFLDGRSDLSDDVIIPLASKFNLSGGQIQDAIFTACNIAKKKNVGVSELSSSDLYEGCKAQSNKGLTTLAKKIDIRHTWEDIILPVDIKKQLKEISGHIKYKGTVYLDWGFDEKLSIGKGVNVLFSGPSGTGKTMSAEIIANDVELDIYKIDLSSVVSKYIGETEKNLNKIFKEAETSNAILFFDEADALFGKRSEVKDAHDRYANIEIGYLLQKMEEYEGIVILATNLSKNIDDAFLRRIQFLVEFPFPNETLRKLIWTGMFPKIAPLSKDIDFKFLSKELKLAGGNIKNIAVAAAFYAAEESNEIRMNHIMHAARREYEKMGKPFIKTDFEPYYEF